MRSVSTTRRSSASCPTGRCSPHAREPYVDWEQVAADTAAMLRMDAGRHPEDPGLARLIGDLSIRSPEFRRLWARNRVHERSVGAKRYHHPLVGDVTITYQALSPGDDPEQTLFVYDTEPGSGSAHALQLLAAQSPPTRTARLPVAADE
ncbi:hypothetical protein NLM24_13090 [Nocardia zapadnayensis]|uniref:MmyB family transcriptional regulator n=1 Tax=Nocardia rhamnosiphila TaxID=426716 RepID=UPI002246A00D|nr:hypothetical protein [Nocardia zapadnayensis]MCX0271626.1 hypothetical protein [Nocardia zapadnayensis]